MRWCCELRVFRLPCDRLDSCVLALAGDQFFRRRLIPKHVPEFEDNRRELISWIGLPWNLVQTGVEALGLGILQEQEAFRFWFSIFV